MCYSISIREWKEPKGRRTVPLFLSPHSIKNLKSDRRVSRHVCLYAKGRTSKLRGSRPRPIPTAFMTLSFHVQIRKKRSSRSLSFIQASSLSVQILFATSICRFDYLYVSPDICRIVAGEDADRASVRDAERRCSRQYGLYPILIDFDQCYF